MALEIEASMKHSYQPFSELPQPTKAPILYFGAHNNQTKSKDLKAEYLQSSSGIFSGSTGVGGSNSSISKTDSKLGLLSAVGLVGAGILAAAFVFLKKVNP